MRESTELKESNDSARGTLQNQLHTPARTEPCVGQRYPAERFIAHTDQGIVQNQPPHGAGRDDPIAIKYLHYKHKVTRHSPNDDKARPKKGQLICCITIIIWNQFPLLYKLYK